jgi:hypothetical protein
MKEKLGKPLNANYQDAKMVTVTYPGLIVLKNAKRELIPIYFTEN